MDEKGVEISSLNPGWVKRRVPDTYADNGLKRIIMFYVINTPCTDLSSSGISVQEYGWDKNVWKNNELKSALFDVAALKANETLFVTKNIDGMKYICEKAKMKKKFHDNRDVERIAIYLGRYNTFLSICYHIRNAFAHGRLAMYENKDGEIVFALEDGIKRSGKFQVRSRMILKKSTLLKWIEIIERKNLEVN